MRLSRIILILTLPLAALATIEVILRVVQPAAESSASAFPLNRELQFLEYYETDPELFWKFKPSQRISSRTFSDIDYAINSHRLRGPEIRSARPDVRILALGNSCTFGWGVRERDIWVRRLEQTLTDSLPGRSVEVINAGVPGYSSYQALHVLPALLADFSPDIAIIMVGWNDQWAAGQGISDAERGRQASGFSRFRAWLGELRLVSLLRRSESTANRPVDEYQLGDVTSPRRVPLEDFERNLRAILDTLRGRAVLPVLAVPPVAALRLYFREDTSPFHDRHEQYCRKIRRIAEYGGYPLVDLQRSFDRQSGLFDDAYGDAVHFNGQGHATAATAMADVVLPLLKNGT